MGWGGVLRLLGGLGSGLVLNELGVWGAVKQRLCTSDEQSFKTILENADYGLLRELWISPNYENADAFFSLKESQQNRNLPF